MLVLEIVQSGLSKGENGSYNPQVNCDLNFNGQMNRKNRVEVRSPPYVHRPIDLVPDLCVMDKQANNSYIGTYSSIWTEYWKGTHPQEQ